MDTSQVLKDFEQTTKDLLQVIESFKQEELNIDPFERSWTAGQVIQHLIMSNSGFSQIINGTTKATERNPSQSIAQIKDGFLDFATKTESPEFVRPAIKGYDKQELLQKIDEAMQSIDKVIQSLDLSLTCTAFEIPQLGFLTRLEAVYFVIYHMQRHIHQLRNIAQHLEKSKESQSI